MLSFFDARPKQNPEQTARIKAWVAAQFALSDDVTVMVTELRCTEPGCPPLETVIALLPPSGGQQQFKIHKGVGDITHDDIAEL